MKDVKAILFDLDGTLTDSAQGIMNSYRYVAQQLEVEPPPEAVLRTFIGPPLRSNLARFVPPDMIEQGVKYYLYSMIDMKRSIRENTVYEGINQALKDLFEKGFTLFVATNKRIDLANEIVAHYGWGPLFKEVYGMRPDAQGPPKAEMIATAITTYGLDPQTTVMIGDRHHDMISGKANGVRCIGVGWGYGSQEELEESGADLFIAQPEQLLRLFVA